MENIYSLGEKYSSLSRSYDELQAMLDQVYESNGGEMTDDTEIMEAEKATIDAMRKSIAADLLNAPDEYAAIVKNTEAQKAILMAEYNAIREEQAKVLARYQAKLNAKQRKIDWFKDAIAAAMDFADVNKIGGSRTDNKFSIYFATSKKIEADNDALLAPYKGDIDALLAKLPIWVAVKVDTNKALLKKEAELPAGAEIIETRTLQIR